jgi:hypothetical protein
MCKSEANNTITSNNRQNITILNGSIHDFKLFATCSINRSLQNDNYRQHESVFLRAEE